jgi:histone-lysine N-methyltransferase SETMAR
MHWKSPKSREQKAWKSNLNFQAMMTVYFDIGETVHIDWVSKGQTINKVYYKEVLTILRERARRKSPKMLKKGSWIHHHDNALSVRTFLAKHKIPVLEHPPCSPDLAPCDFFVFKKQVCIKRNPF